MTKQKTSSDYTKENAVGGLHEVSAKDSKPKDNGNSDQEEKLDSQTTVEPGSDIDDAGPLSI